MAPARQATRFPICTQVELRCGAHVYRASMQNFSRFGAYVGLGEELPVGSEVELELPVGGPHVMARGRVVHRIVAADALRLGTVAGVGVRFVEPLDLQHPPFETSMSLAPESGGRVAFERVRAAAKPTRRIVRPVLASLLSACRAPASSEEHVVFAGALSAVDLPTILSMLERARKSGRLVVERDHTTVTIDLVDGRIVDARSSTFSAPPHATVMVVLDWRRGSFCLSAVGVRPVPRSILPSLTQLLLQHAKRRGARASAPHPAGERSGA